MGYTVLSVAYPLTPVGEDAPGGSEQILTLLDRELTKAGHRSFVVAAEGSKVSGTLLASPAPPQNLDGDVRKWAEAVHRRLVMEAINRYHVDVVHMHALDFHRYVPPGLVPVLATLHLPIDWYPREIFSSKRKNFLLNCVSSSQERACPPCSRLLPCVPNGIYLRNYSPGLKEDFYLALGRVCPEKGFHHALDAARQADLPMVLAGPVLQCREHLQYFEAEIAPRLDSKRQYVGPVGLAEKRELLRKARALVVPSEVAETSSLVAMEAMASGTPVIAMPAGALPELIEHGRTGFVVSDVSELAGAMNRARQLRPEDCRAAAVARFDGVKTAARYLQLYDRLVRTCREDHPAKPGLSWLFPNIAGGRRVANQS